MMPHEGGGTEPEYPASLLQPPAHIHVIASHPELRIKSADRFQTLFAKSHIASGNVLGHKVRQKHVAGPARRVSYAIGNRAVSARRNIRPAQRRQRRTACAQKACGDVREPMRIWISIVVDVRYDFTRCSLKTRVAGAAQALVLVLMTRTPGCRLAISAV